MTGLAESERRPSVARLLRSRPGRRISAGEYLFLPGDPATSSYYLRRGLVITSLLSPDGGELIVHLHEPGEVIGEPCLPEGERGYHARALEDSEIVKVTCAEVLAHLQRDPEALLEFLRALERHLSEIRVQLLSLTTEHVRLRLVRTLLSLAERIGDEAPEGVRIAHHLRQVDLARIVGARREVVSRELNRLRREGVIRYSARGPIWIHLTALRKLREALEESESGIERHE